MTATAPWSPIEIEVKLRQVIEDQDEAVRVLKGMADEYGSARRDYEVKKAQAFLTAKNRSDLTTVDLRTAWATEQSADLRMEKDIAESRFVAQRAAVQVLISQADSLRSLLRSSRDLHEQPGFGS